MKLRKLIAGGLFTLMLGVVGTGGLLSVKAACWDSEYNFQFFTAHSSQYSSVRTKETDSSVYINPTSGVPFTASVVGANYNSIRCNPLHVAPGRTYLMTNYAVEDNNYNSIGIRLAGMGDYGGSSAGLWSPDYC